MKHHFKKNDPIYCAASLGMNKCRTDRAKAIKAAYILLGQMKTIGWSIVVWENLGWHFELKNGIFSLHKSSVDGSFHLYVNGLDGLGNEICQYYHKDPNVAVRKAIRFINECASRVTRDIRKQEKRMGV